MKNEIPYLIAEIGINHNGHLENVFKLIDQAVEAGWNMVKFQKRDPDVCVPENQKNNIKTWEGQQMTYLEYKKKIEFGLAEYWHINQYCKEKGIRTVLFTSGIKKKVQIPDEQKELLIFN